MASILVPKVGAFGVYGGRYVPELLVPALEELERARKEIVPSREFKHALSELLGEWAGRPTPLLTTPAFSEACGLDAVIYMGEKDMERQAPNVKRMELCGARVVPVTSGARTLKDAINEALRDWTQNLETTHYMLGTVCGPHPFPRLVRDFQAVIGREALAQWRKLKGGLPDAVVACVGGGSNAIGIFHAFVPKKKVQLIGLEPGGLGLESGKHGATLVAGTTGLLHGARTSVLQDEEGQILEPHSVSAGLDYPGVGPEHAHLRDTGRARYLAIDDDEALDAFETFSRLEGIIPAFEPSHALAFLLKAVRINELPARARVLMNLCGRGDKDLDNYFAHYASRNAGSNA